MTSMQQEPEAIKAARPEEPQPSSLARRSRRPNNHKLDPDGSAGCTSSPCVSATASAAARQQQPNYHHQTTVPSLQSAPGSFTLKNCWFPTSCLAPVSIFLWRMKLLTRPSARPLTSSTSGCPGGSVTSVTSALPPEALSRFSRFAAAGTSTSATERRRCGIESEQRPEDPTVFEILFSKKRNGEKRRSAKVKSFF